MHKRPFVTAARVCVCVVKMFPTLNGERQKEEKYTHTHTRRFAPVISGADTSVPTSRPRVCFFFSPVTSFFFFHGVCDFPNVQFVCVCVCFR